MPLDPQEVRKIAFLARIKITDAERETLATELNGIIEWVEQLNEVDTTNVKPMTSVTEMLGPQRPDEVTSRNVSEKILANAPERMGNFYTVPKVVE
tara:strand:+ start:193 stop:480 length:288 start_codon:yes stop_codon:yes gene_type:complete